MECGAIQHSIPVMYAAREQPVVSVREKSSLTCTERNRKDYSSSLHSVIGLYGTV